MLLTFDISSYIGPTFPTCRKLLARFRYAAWPSGASLMGLKIFSSLGLTTTSTYVQAIEQRRGNTAVDVMNESTRRPIQSR